ncbi:efflux RND transporter periplasmic adaptor subunit [uncultured Pseudodesulfovibrio sp.]|uniref:efflux RND transporter periplasmic adaptor subunit n=1 Tax=uncultured Pseudodesulfovibrio sp. TaxID=2035858 RepID=UPI0029C7CA05|nr:efflux RND transporter periplasmic adaptor subunit [uncultured Pseudodesulfovibrio sp.]
MSKTRKTGQYATFLLPALALLILLFPGAAKAKTLDQAMTFEGKVYYRVVRTVTNKFQGEMELVSVTTEEPVTKGQVLGTYELAQHERNKLLQRISKVAIENEELQIDEFATNLQIEEKRFASLRQLYLEGMKSQFELDSAKKIIEQQKKRLDFKKKKLQKQVRDWRKNVDLISQDLGGISLKSGKIRKGIPLISPIDGNVLEWRDSKQWNNMPPGTVCFKVADIKEITVKARVFVEDYPKLAVGMKAEVTSAGYPGKTFQATLSKLPLTPIDKGYTALSYYLVEFEMDNSDMLFREGNSVTVKLPPQTVESGAREQAAEN